MQFQRATKQQAKLRCAIFGPSGAGKTFTALRIASGMGQRIAVIDTEFGSASKYADRFAFDVCDLTTPTIQNYINLIQQAGAHYDVLIIDSMSHGWQELLDMIDQLAKTKFKGNSWSAWSEGTPLQREFVRAIQTCPCHLIATMRSKTEWTTQTDDKGRTRPMRVGLSPEQGKGIEYEFDLLLEMSTEHYCTVIKDRTGRYQDKIFEKPSEEFGKALYNWLNEGTPAQQQAPKHTASPQAQPQCEQQYQASPPPQNYAPQGQPPQQPNYGGNYPQPGEPFRGPAADHQTHMTNAAGQALPPISPASMNILNACADFFRQKAAKELPGYSVDFQRMLTVIFNRYGKWPTTQAGAKNVKAEVRLDEIAVQLQGAA